MVNNSDLIHTELSECVHQLTAVCVYVCECVTLLWFPGPGMCEDLAGWAARHLLNIRGNNSWADLKHGHPLHLSASLRTSPAASPPWQVPVHRHSEPGRTFGANPLKTLCSPSSSSSSVDSISSLSLYSCSFVSLAFPRSGAQRMGTMWVVH